MSLSDLFSSELFEFLVVFCVLVFEDLHKKEPILPRTLFFFSLIRLSLVLSWTLRMLGGCLSSSLFNCLDGELY